MFDEPQEFAAVCVTNYTRTPARGAKEWEIVVDDFIVYQGIMRQQTSHPTQRDAVLFSEEPAVLEKFDLENDIYIPSEADLIQYIEAEQRGTPKIKGGGQKSGRARRPETAMLAF